MRSFIRILAYAANYRILAGLNILFNLLYALFSLFSLLMVIPFLRVLFGTVAVPDVKPVFHFSVDGLVAQFNWQFGTYITEHGQSASLILICAGVIIVFFLKNLCRYMAMFFLSPLRNGVVRDLRKHLYEKVLQLPVSYFTEKRKGDVIARMTTDVNEVEWSIMNTLESAFREPIMIVLFLISMFMISVQLTVFVFILLPLTGVIIGMVGKTLKQQSRKAQDKMGDILSLIEESLSGLRIIKAFNAQSYLDRRFDGEVNEHYKLLTGVLRRRDLSSPLSEFLGIGVVAVVLWFGGRMVIDPANPLDAEVFIGYIIIFANLINPAKSFANAYFHIQRGVASVERIESLLDEKISISEIENPVSPDHFESIISYENVDFSYGDSVTVLNNINLDVHRGKMIAIVGQSGAGKSTLVDLLPRFYDPTGGRITIDGTDTRQMGLNNLRALMGIVTQESILFNDTVFNNISFGVDGATEEQVTEAARVANAHQFISKMQNGYHTIVGDRGTKLSGGERQRLTIARAILRNPPILILDEATSALDTENEKLVQDALFKLMRNRTSIVIAHRLSTIKYADEILVMQEGSIIERGNHNSLLGRNGVYRRLVEMQAF